MKLSEFVTRVLPAVRATVTDADDGSALKAKALAVLGDEPLTDEGGEAIDVSSLDLVTMPASGAGEAGQDAEAVAALVEKAVARALASTPPVRPAFAAPVRESREAEITVPATVRRSGRLRSFAGPDAEQKAYAFGRWVMAAVGSEKSAQWCRDHGVVLVKAQEQASNAAGGFLVPDRFSNDLVDLREQYGVFRRNARVVPMMGDTLAVPRRSGGLTAYWVGENTAPTESSKSWDQVQLVAKKLGVLTKYSSELAEDAILSIADDLASEIAYAFAFKEDQTGFNGDGTSTYGGIRGVRSSLGAGGIVTGSGDTWAELALADFHQAIALLPEYAEQGQVKWYCSKAFFGQVMQKLIYASGGTTAEHLQGGTGRTFLGYSVEVSQVLPTATATNTVACLFGNLRMAAMLGDRRQTSLAFSEHLNFAEDELAIRGTERLDIVVHDAGTASAAGPIVGLKTSA